MKSKNEEKLSKMSLDSSELSAFSDETLGEMAMENVEGGIDLNVSKCGGNNCSGGNCAKGCGIVTTDSPQQAIVP